METIGNETLKTVRYIRDARDIREEDKIVREALEIAERFKVLPYYEAYEILKTKLGNISAGTQ